MLLPEERMVEPARKIIEENHLDVVYLEAVHTVDAVNKARIAVETGAHILVARGYQAKLIKEYTNIPVVEIRFHAQEIGLLIQKVRELLPDKLITAFDYGGYTGFNQTTMNAISYMWPNFGCSSNPPSGLPKSKWAKLSLHYTSGWPTCDQIQNCASSYNGYGAVMSFNLRNYDCSGTMNCFAPYVWGGRTVSYTGTSYSKNY